MIFYHVADLDGHASGAIAKKFLPAHELVPFNYGYEVPWKKIEKAVIGGEHIYLLDISFSPADMVKLDKLCESYKSKLVWIDHHQIPKETSINDDYPARLRAIASQGKHEIGRAACELAWEYFTKEPCPLAIRLIGAYDVWNFSGFVHDRTSYGKDDIMAFQYGMKTANTDPRVYNWKNLLSFLDPYCFKAIKDGANILAYQQERDRHLKYTLGKHLGYDAIIINNQGINSNAFETLCAEKDIDLSGLLMVAYYQFDGKTYYSLYTQSDNIDCSALARERGGGGHKKAAGYNE